MLRQLPPGTQPPFILTYNASTRADPAARAVRARSCPSSSSSTSASTSSARSSRRVQGASIPYPLRRQAAADPGRPRSARRCRRRDLAPADVVNAISAQNLILPGGTPKIGDHRVRRRPERAARRPIEELNDLPIKTVDGTHDLHPRRRARARRLPAADQHRARRRPARGAADDPEDRQRLDARHHRRASRRRCRGSQAEPAAGARDRAARRPVAVRARRRSQGVLREARDRRVPDGADDPAVPRQLAQHADHRGLDSAVDPRVDHRAQRARRDDQHHDARRPRARRRHPGRRRDGRDREHQLAPRAGQGRSSRRSSTARSRSPSRRSSRRSASASCSCRCSSSTGVARYLFVPMAEAVVFAMLASYVLSRTLVPTMAKYLLQAHEPHGARRAERAIRSCCVQRALRRAASCGMRDGYRALLERCVGSRADRSRALFLGGLRRVARARCRWVGEDFFPAVDAGQFKLHLRAPTGTRIEETARALRPGRGRDPRAIIPRERARQRHRQHRPAVQRHQPLATATRRRSAPATPTSWSSLDAGPPADRRLRPRAAADAAAASFPASRSRSCRPTSSRQILNFGLPAPIDVQVVGRNLEANRAFAGDAGRRSSRRCRASWTCACSRRSTSRGCTSTSTARAPRSSASPQRDVANNLLISLSRQRPDGADLLAEPGDGRQLRGGDADAAVPRWTRCRSSATSRSAAAPARSRRCSQALATMSARQRGTAVVVALQRAAGHRHLRRRAGARPRRRRARHRADPRRRRRRSCRAARRSSCAARSRR